MKYKIIKDNENYMLGFQHTGTDKDTFELNPVGMNLNYLNCYKVLETTVEWDEVKYEKVKAQEEEEKKKPTWQEKMESQVMWTALETDTLLESEEE